MGETANAQSRAEVAGTTTKNVLSTGSWGWYESSPAKGQQGKRGKRQIVRTNDIPGMNPIIPNNRDYILWNDRVIITVVDFNNDGVINHRDSGSRSSSYSPTIELWGRYPALHHNSQAGDRVVVLEGVARMGDYVTWTRTYLYDERNKYEAMLPVARADTYEEYVSGKADYNNTFLSAENGKANTTGYSNTASGSGALKTNTTGYSNTASGYRALILNTTGSSNTASGDGALSYNTTGSSNTASGGSALYNNYTGFYNTASGTSALFYNTRGIANTASGNSALYNNTTGSYNTASGDRALNSQHHRVL